MKSVSIIAPLYNEVDNVKELHREIKEVCEKNNFTYEIIFIDDGSKDRTVEVARELSPLKLIELRKNFGQTAAMDAGIKEAQYDYIITMDGDRQNDPEDIPALINHLESEGLDVVSGWRKNRKDTFSKKFISRGANFLRSRIINDGIHDSGCSLKIYRKECFEELNLYGEMHRFIPALLKIQGFKVGEIIVNHRPRIAGVTKYNWRRTFKGFVDMISVWFWNKYSMRPMHLMGGLGIAFLMGAFLCGLISIIEFVNGQSMSDTAWPLLTIFLSITGIQLFISGLMADMMSKSYFESVGKKAYSVKKVEVL